MSGNDGSLATGPGVRISDGRFAKKENDSIRFSTTNFSLLIMNELIYEALSLTTAMQVNTTVISLNTKSEQIIKFLRTL